MIRSSRSWVVAGKFWLSAEAARGGASIERPV